MAVPGKFYLGPLTDLQELEVPDSYNRTPSRVQSVFQAATGRRTANTTGIKRAFTLEWSHATEDQRARFEHFQYGLQVGTLRFIDPYSVNLLPPRVSNAGSSYGSSMVFDTFPGTQLIQASDASYPVTPRQRFTTKLTATASDSWAYALQKSMKIPGRLGTIVFSAWVLAPNGGQFNLYGTVDDTSTSGIADAGVQTITASASWQRVSITAPVTSGVYGWFIGIKVPASGVITVGPMQAELGTTPTAWAEGTGCSVLIDAYDDDVPFFPYSDINLTLLEI